MKKLPTLYKSTATGATQICNISHKDDMFYVEWGQLDGAQQSKFTKCYTTNAGRSNERNPEAQAAFEAQAKWDKKVKSGYSTDATAPVTVQLPMKVKAWTKDKLPSKVTFPLISTAKYNGVNAMFKRVDGEITIYSRGGEVYAPIPHLEPQMATLMDYLGFDELNVELYIPDFHLQDITSAVKKPNPDSVKLVAIVFDIADCTMAYKHRRVSLTEAFDEFVNDANLVAIQFALGVECNSHQEIEDHYNLCMTLGLEGTVVKHPDALYEHNKRSNRMWKYKKTMDAEFKVTGMQLDKNNHPVYLCESKGGIFKVKRKGTNAERLVDAQINHIGEWLTVEFEMYSKDAIPLKPVGNDFRDCDANGNPRT